MASPCEFHMKILEEGTWHESHVVWHLIPSVWSMCHMTHGKLSQNVRKVRGSFLFLDQTKERRKNSAEGGKERKRKERRKKERKESRKRKEMRKRKERRKKKKK